jgi:hypothetical protein
VGRRTRIIPGIGQGCSEARITANPHACLCPALSCRISGDGVVKFWMCLWRRVVKHELLEVYRRFRNAWMSDHCWSALEILSFQTPSCKSALVSSFVTASHFQYLSMQLNRHQLV